jgi:MFS family permease
VLLNIHHQVHDMLAVLRQRNFALLWFAGLISITGDWTLNVVLPFYVYQMTGSALATGLMFMVRTLPGVLLGSIAGVFVDRWDRKWTMVAVNLFATLLVLLLVTVKSASGLWIVYLVAFIESSSMQFFIQAEKALLPRLVEEKHLVTANSLGALNTNLGMFIGPAIGGALMGLTGLTGVVILDSASYFVAGVMIILISWSPEKNLKKPETPDALKAWLDIWRDWVDGLRLAKRNRAIATVFVAAAVAMLGEGIIQALLVLFVKLLKGGAVELGWLYSFRGLGGLLGGLIFGRIGTAVQPHRIFPWTLAGMGLFLLIMVNIPVLILALIMLCLIGILAIGANVTSTTMLQNSAPNEYLGRIFGVLGMVSSLMILLGQGTASTLASRWGIVVLLNIAGGLYVFSGLIPLAMLRNLSSSSADKTEIVKTFTG